MAGINDYSNTAGSNTTINGIDIAEGCSPAGINNAIRQLMADIADMDDGVVPLQTPDINGGTIDGAVIGGTTPAAGTFTTITTTGDINFGDNDKAVFGAGSDLQIYSDGTTSLITESGSGSLIIRGTQLILQSPAGENLAYFFTDGEAQLYYNGVQKLATKSTGVDVTGTVVSDGLTVDGNATFTSGDTSDQFVITNTDSGTNSAPDLVLYRNSSSPAANDSLGVIAFKGEDSAGNQQDYVNILAGIADPTSGSEDAFLKFFTNAGGTTNSEFLRGESGVLKGFYQGSQKLETTSSGITVTGTVTATSFSGDGSALTGISGGENTPAFKVYLTSAQSISRSSFTKVQFNTTSGSNNTGWNVGSGFDTTNYRFTCPSGKSGKYYFSVSLLIEYANALNEYGIIRWYKNGSEYANFRQGMNSGGLEYSFTSNTIIDLSDSDYVEVYVSQESSDSENIDANSRYTWFEGYKLIGA